MASTISAGTTTTTALVQTADTSGVLQLQTNGTTTAVTIDTSQNVGIGTTSPNIFSRPSGLSVGISSANNAFLQINSATGSQAEVAIGVNAVRQASIFSDASTFSLIAATSIPMVFGTANTERARIDTSGSFIVGATNTTSWGAIGINSKSTAASQQCFSGWNADTSGTRYFAYFGVGATYTNVGSIYYNGTATIYGSVSDERLKTNIVDANSGLAKLANVRIRSFDWKDSGNHTDFGVVAQELNEVAPEAVGQGIDKEDGSIDKPWSVDTSVLTPAIIKAIQELSAQVTTLQTQVTALQAKG